MVSKHKQQAKAAAKASKKGDAAPAKPSESRQRGKSISSFHDDLERELAALGLRVKQITADGNCLFRALGDQVQGDQGLHAQLRQQVVEFMREHEDDFAPFMDGDESFQAYAGRMCKEGVWGGNMELQAASRLLNSNVHIYQAGQPRWSLANFAADVPSLHLSYHGGEHYNSVRLADDYGSGAPQPVLLSAGGSSAAQQRAEAVAQWSERDEAHVLANTACANPALVRKALTEASGDVDAAIECIIGIMGREQEQGLEQREPAAATAQGAESAKSSGLQRDGPEDCGSAASDLDSHAAPSAAAEPPAAAGAQSDSCAEQLAPQALPEASVAAASPLDATANAEHAAATPAAPSTAKRKKPQASDTAAAKPARNKTCPCGSGKKYKACCGAAAAAAERRRKQLGLDTAGAADRVAAQVATLYV